MHDWDRILAEYGPVVWKQTLRMLGDRSDAADCFQSVMLDAFELSEREPIANWPGLLRRLAVLRSLDRLRERYRRRIDPRPVEDLGIACRQAAVGTEAEHQELVEQLRRELAALPEQQAAAFALRWIDDMTNEEIAEHMQITTNHVGVLLHRARRTLQYELASEGVRKR